MFVVMEQEETEWGVGEVGRGQILENLVGFSKELLFLKKSLQK